MKSVLSLFIMLVTLSVQAQNISIDTEKATVKFVFQDEDVDGTLSEFDFTGSINLDDLDNSVFSGTVATETLDTDNWLRNKILRGRKYFNAKEHPALSFKSTEIRSGGGREFLVTGNLTIKGISKVVTFTFNNSGIRLYGTVLINTTDWDISIYKEVERNVVSIMISMPYSQ